MKNLIYNGIDKFDDTCEKIYENIYKPLKDTGSDYLQNNEYINPLIKLRHNITSNKIRLFMNNIEDKTGNDIKDFINNLTPDELIIFSEMTNKVVDLDDSIQIFITSMLMKNLKDNGELNYQEKSLYYNIKQLTEDDFKIFYCYLKNGVIDSPLYEKKLKNENYNLIELHIDTRLKNHQLIESVLRKFVSYNILIDKSFILDNKDEGRTVFQNNTTDITTKFGLTDFSINFYNLLKIFFEDKNDICKNILTKKRSHSLLSKY